MINLTDQQKQNVAIILQLEFYNGKKVNEELINSILLKFNKSLQNIDEALNESNKPPKGCQMTWGPNDYMK